MCFEFTIYPTITKLFNTLTVEMVLSVASKWAHSHHCANVGLCRFWLEFIVFFYGQVMGICVFFVLTNKFPRLSPSPNKPSPFPKVGSIPSNSVVIILKLSSNVRRCCLHQMNCAIY